MHVLSTLLPLGFMAQLTSAAYSLKDDYGTSDSFFDNFNFFTDHDPTNGYVNYVDRDTATKNGLINTHGNGVYIGVDNTTVSSDPGRASVRLESTKTYKYGLIILDLSHMPASTCGSWPAFWMLGNNWPSNGEIDIIEGLNDQTSNQMALHTSDGCSIDTTGFTGHLDTSNCYVDADGQPANSGCAIRSDHTESYGTGFNDNGGGVYATEWTSDAINVWFWPSDSVPRDIGSDSPSPVDWGNPTAKFAGDCDIDSHFDEMRIVFDITFCGDWAGEVWGSSSCAEKSGSCNDYVQNNPSAFTESYWQVRSLKVYDRPENDDNHDDDHDDDHEKGHGRGYGHGHGGGPEKRAAALNRRQQHRHARGHGGHF
ncbi:Concanavalin A-like lectin/glucanases superfamily [Penicillium bovifimosum]|uniref:endo-1,3(4)-beta-glucanase n=1 Tax=Penicillium bovifimosum TaxID=126998 RepID=A0A9W9HBL4_9EURO|nr:Concanavalin A-like lectin/glucanases superfamily [Penicillium bovifimosum]KAJ5143608.1 Concanavalin A-like lectin/glucanases superfamily [Penicillium bovifimosum]